MLCGYAPSGLRYKFSFFLFIKILQNTSYITYMHLHCIPTEYILKETLELIPCAKVPAVRLKGSLRINLNLKFEHRIFNYFTIIYIYIFWVIQQWRQEISILDFFVQNTKKCPLNCKLTTYKTLSYFNLKF